MNDLVREESPLAKHHDRAAFDCGDLDLNTYLQRYARKNHDKGGAKCFIASAVGAPARILGFYTLSPASIDIDRAPAVSKAGLGRYEIPVFRLGRLAVDQKVQAKGLGGALLLLAAERAMMVAQEAGGVGLLIDAKNNRAAQWYESYGAVPFPETPLSLVLTFAVVRDAIARSR